MDIQRIVELEVQERIDQTERYRLVKQESGSFIFLDLRYSNTVVMEQHLEMTRMFREVFDLPGGWMSIWELLYHPTGMDEHYLYFELDAQTYALIVDVEEKRGNYVVEVDVVKWDNHPCNVSSINPFQLTTHVKETMRTMVEWMEQQLISFSQYRLFFLTESVVMNESDEIKMLKQRK